MRARLLVALGGGRCRLIGGRGSGRVSGEHGAREQSQGNDWDELLEHRFGLQGERGRVPGRAYYDWNQPPQVPYDRKVMFAVNMSQVTDT